VVIFGGKGSTTREMSDCYPDYLALSPQEGSQLLGCLASQIDENPGKKFVIVGHSSGATPAESLARALADKDLGHVRLVLLEGYAFPFSQTGVAGSCWYAENKSKKIRGFNAPSMLDPAVCPQPANAFAANWCANQLCLHIANVNLNVPPGLTPGQALTQGLANCRGNNAWMTDELKAWLAN